MPVLSNEIILDLPIPLEELNVLFKRYEKKFLADISQSSAVYIPLGGTLKSNELYYKDFIYKMNLLYSFWSKGIYLKIKYINPSKGTYNPLNRLSQKVENWANLSTPVKKKNTLMERLKKEEKEEYEEKFIDENDELPEKIMSSALNEWVFNIDTIRQVLHIVMTEGIKIDYGQKIGKTIIFAKNHSLAIPDNSYKVNLINLF